MPIPCPACGSTARSPLYRGLTDITFGSASGRWDLDRCLDCGSVYLNPPPTADELDQAYSTYYTHATPKTAPPPPPRGIVQKLAAGYRDWRYAGRSPTWGAWMTSRLLPPVRQRIDLRHRFLPPARPDSTVLDVGCGPGSFLQTAQSVGYKAKGIDSDDAAVAFGRSRGLDCSTESTEDVVASGERFDAVTLSQVIEHVPQPRPMLRTLLEVLRPGGVLFVSTPNIRARGHARFREFWRGLEVPRHLVIFSRPALENAIRDAGFVDISFHWNPESDWRLYEKSWLLSQGCGPYHRDAISRRRRLQLLTWSAIDPGEPEGLIVTARRPGGPS